MKLFGSTNTRTRPSSNDITLSSGRGSLSDHSNRYEKPVQPPPRMPTRSPFGSVARVPAAFLISATALSVTAIDIRSSAVSVRPVRLRALRLVVRDRALDRILGQHRAVDLDRRQIQ